MLFGLLSSLWAVASFDIVCISNDSLFLHNLLFCLLGCYQVDFLTIETDVIEMIINRIYFGRFILFRNTRRISMLDRHQRWLLLQPQEFSNCPPKALQRFPVNGFNEFFVKSSRYYWINHCLGMATKWNNWNTIGLIA